MTRAERLLRRQARGWGRQAVALIAQTRRYGISDAYFRTTQALAVQSARFAWRRALASQQQPTEVTHV